MDKDELKEALSLVPVMEACLENKEMGWQEVAECKAALGKLKEAALFLIDMQENEEAAEAYVCNAQQEYDQIKEQHQRYCDTYRTNDEESIDG